MADAASAENGGTAAGGYAGAGVLFDRFQIDPARTIDALNTPSARAYGTTDLKDPDRELFALVCAPAAPVRAPVMAMIKGSGAPGVLELVEWGAMEWPPIGQRTMTVVYERPHGRTLADAFASPDVRFSDYDVPKRLIEPLVRAIHELSGAGIVHRAIRPTNVFFADEACTTPVLGDCVTAPAGADQPPVFEPVERAMAMPSGRGEGEPEDDIYALAVTLVVALLGRDPTAGMRPDEMIQAKLERGSYGTLCERERIPMALIEPLRGMLHDEAHERWGFDEIELWLSGRRVPPARKRPVRAKPVPFAFAGEEYLHRPLLARAMAHNVREAARSIRGGQLDAWLKRTMAAPEVAAAIAESVDLARAHESDVRGSDEYLVSRTVIDLDPVGPVRYKGFSFAIDGFGPALATAWLGDGNAQMPAEIISLGLASYWLSVQPRAEARFTALDRMFAQLRGYLQAQGPGYGLERCLYETNPALPCQSPLLAPYYVVEIRELLPALDEAASRASGQTKPMDRHIAAFIAARFRHDIEPHLAALGEAREERSLIGMLSLLALLQWRLKTPALFGLASWVGGLLGPAINTYHNRDTRRQIEREIPRLVRQGSLPEIYDLIDNAERRRRDRDGYAAASAAFAAAEAEVQEIETSDVARSEASVQMGRKWAAIASTVIAMVTITVSLLLLVG